MIWYQANEILVLILNSRNLDALRLEIGDWLGRVDHVLCQLTYPEIGVKDSRTINQDRWISQVINRSGDAWT